MIKRFDSFEAYEPTLAVALKEAKRFVASIRANPWETGYCLTLAGESGNGKTMLAKAILAELGWNAWGICAAIPEVVANGKLLRFETHFFDLRTVSDRLKGGEWDLVEVMEQPRLAVLDDFGSDYDPNRLFVAKMDRILRARARKWTVVTANLKLAEVARLDARIASWMIRDNNRAVEIEAGDYALRH